jgi:S1-C subfamily serine protease
MTTFGKFLLLLLLALISGSVWIIAKNLERPDAEVAATIALIATSTQSDQHSSVLQNTAITTFTPQEKTPATSSLSIPAQVPVPVPKLPTTNYSLPTPPPDWDKINIDTRGALANILCTAKYGDQFKPLSGSGVFIDPRGIILTNAHVAQYILLTGGDEKSNLLDCVVRVGNPASPRYKANILYLSPKWIQDNAKKLLEENATESGENDYALLLITDMVNPNISLPDSFPSIQLSEKPIDKIEIEYFVAGYPAGFLGGIAIQRELWSVSSFATISKKYTFKENTLDMVGLNGNLLAQKGSSGGAFVNSEGKLAGLLVTSTLDGNTDAREVRALTTEYINRAFTEEAGFSIFELANTNLPFLLSQFSRDFVPYMRQRLVDALGG